MALPKVMKRASLARKGPKQAGAMKKRGSKIARGRMAMSQVLKGRKEKTVGGLTKGSLMKNKRNKVVSKRANALGKQRYRNIRGWTESVMRARKELKIPGFVAINGKTAQGKALYVKAKV